MRRATAIDAVVAALCCYLAYGGWLAYDYYEHHHGDWRIGVTAVGIGLIPVTAFLVLAFVTWLITHGLRLLRRTGLG